MLAPGFASDAIFDLQWQRRHGAAKRINTVAALIVEEGWKAQQVAAELGDPANAPALTVDAAMLLANAALHGADSQQACTREEVEAAFAWLCTPNVGLAIRDGDGIVILRPPKNEIG